MRFNTFGNDHISSKWGVWPAGFLGFFAGGLLWIGWAVGSGTGHPSEMMLWAEQGESAPSGGPPALSVYPSEPQDSTPKGMVYLPGEFEPQEAIVLPAGLLAQRYPQLLAAMLEAIEEHTAVVGLVSDARQRDKVEKLLADRKTLRRGLRLVEIPHNTLWIRDYGPIFFRFPDAHPGAYDAEYPDPRRRLDDAVPARLAALFGASVFPLPMVLEGGNFLTNGRGIGLTTTQAVLRHGGPSASEASFRQFLYQYLGIDSLVILEPLAGEPTGHVDMFACFTAPDTVLVGQYDPKEDPENAAILDRNAAALAGCRTSAGPLRVIRLPMPTHRDGVWRTYSNVVFANRVLLVPVYPTVDPAGSEKALETFRHAAPGRKVIGIDASELIGAGGGLRCITLGVPSPGHGGPLGAAIGGGSALAWSRKRLPMSNAISFWEAIPSFSWSFTGRGFCPSATNRP